jgi:hypothetical protein
MASIPLSSNPGDQTATQTPQAAQSATAGVNAGSVQPGTANAALQSTQGISLTPTPVSTVALSGSAGQTSTTLPKQQHLNPVLVVLTLALLIVAVALFWAVSASGKKHNQY